MAVETLVEILYAYQSLIEPFDMFPVVTFSAVVVHEGPIGGISADVCRVSMNYAPVAVDTVHVILLYVDPVSHS